MNSVVSSTARGRRTLRFVGSAFAAGVVSLGLAVPASAVPVADAPAPAARSAGDGWVISIGDSYISGEAGRWAGNSDTSELFVDAGGWQAYRDKAASSVDKWGQYCDRSTSALVHVGGGRKTLNLACSGALTVTTGKRADGDFKPGVDFYDKVDGKGQLTLLKEFGTGKTIDTVVLSIGGNDFQFGGIVKSCIGAFLGWQKPCSENKAITDLFSPDVVKAKVLAISKAIQRLRLALDTSGNTAARIVVDTYPNPVANAAGTRTEETYLDRFVYNGCPLYDADLTWASEKGITIVSGAVRSAVAQSGVAGVRLLNMDAATVGHRLCEKNVATLPQRRPVRYWSDAGAWDKSEWIAQIRTVSTVGSNYKIQESFHPNWWGQLAMRNCFRQVLDDPTGPASLWCKQNPARSFDKVRGEPVMVVTTQAPTLATPRATAGSSQAERQVAAAAQTARGDIRGIPRPVYPVQTGDRITMNYDAGVVNSFRPVSLYPSSSNSGEVLAYLADDRSQGGGASPVVRVVVGGTPRINLPSTGAPQVTADGRDVVVVQGSRVLAYNTATTARRVLCQACGSGLLSAARSPNGKYLAVLSSTPLSSKQLLTIRRLSDGAVVGRARFEPTSGFPLAWDPASTSVGFAAVVRGDLGSRSFVQLLRTDGRGQATPLNDATHSYLGPRWIGGSLWGVRVTDAVGATATGAVRVELPGGTSVPIVHGPIDPQVLPPEALLLAQSTWAR